MGNNGRRSDKREMKGVVGKKMKYKLKKRKKRKGGEEIRRRMTIKEPKEV